MGLPRWNPLTPGAPLAQVLAELNKVLPQWFPQIDGGDRARAGLTATVGQASGGRLKSGVEPSADVAGATAGVLGKVSSSAFSEPFDALPDADQWDTLAGAVTATLASTGVMGGRALRQTGAVTIRMKFDINFDPSKLYRLRARASRVSGAPTLSFGLACYTAAGALVGTVYACASASAPATGSYTEYTGWVQGTGAPSGTLPAADPAAPTPLPTGTVAVRPVIAISAGGVLDLDSVDFDRLDEDLSKRAYTTLLPTDDPRYVDDGARFQELVIDEAAFQDESISERTIQTDAIIARHIVAGAIETEHLTADLVLAGRVESIEDPTMFLDFRRDLAPTAKVFSHPAFTLRRNGTATFGGAVTASSFTAPSVAFDGDALIQGAVVLAGGTELFGAVTFALGTTVTFNAGFSAANATIAGVLNAGTVIAAGVSATSVAATSVSAGTITQTGGAVSITGSRATELASIVQQLLGVLAARGFIANNTTA